MIKISLYFLFHVFEMFSCHFLIIFSLFFCFHFVFFLFHFQLLSYFYFSTFPLHILTCVHFDIPFMCFILFPRVLFPLFFLLFRCLMFLLPSSVLPRMPSIFRKRPLLFILLERKRPLDITEDEMTMNLMTWHEADVKNNYRKGST